MTQYAQKLTEEGAYVVHRPRATDALGNSLRRAFTPQASTAEFDRLLARLDRLYPR